MPLRRGDGRRRQAPGSVQTGSACPSRQELPVRLRSARQIARNQRAHAHLAVEFLLAPCSEGLQNLGGRVGEQREGERVLVGELAVALDGVLADADDVVAEREEALVVVPEVACLGGASGRRVLGVEVYTVLRPRRSLEFLTVPSWSGAEKVGSFEPVVIIAL